MKSWTWNALERWRDKAFAASPPFDLRASAAMALRVRRPDGAT